MKYARKIWMRRVLAWVLAFVMVVPWNVLAEEGSPAPDDKAETTTEVSVEQEKEPSVLDEDGGGNRC